MTPAPPTLATTGSLLRALGPSVYLPALLEFAGTAAIMPVIPLIALQMGFDAPQAAALTAMFGVAALLGPIPVGRAITRIGAQRALVIAGIAQSLSGAGLFAVVEYGADGSALVSRMLLVGLLFVVAICMQVWSLGRQTYMGLALPAAVRARGMSLFGGALRFGQVLGPLLGAIVIAAGRDSAVFLLLMAMALSATVLVARFMPPGEEPRGTTVPARTRPLREGERAPVSSGSSAPFAASSVAVSPAERRLHRAVFARMLIVACGILPLTIARVNKPVVVPLLASALGLDAFWVSMVFGVSAAVEIVLVVPAGIMMDRWGRAAVVVPCLSIVGCSFVLQTILAISVGQLSHSGAIAAVLASGIVMALGNGLGSGIVMTLGLDVSPPQERTRYLAWWNTLIGGGSLAAPLLTAAVTAIASVFAASTVIGVLCWAGAAWLAVTLPRVRPSGSLQRS